jgi:hypothetical protein
MPLLQLFIESEVGIHLIVDYLLNLQESLIDCVELSKEDEDDLARV